MEKKEEKKKKRRREDVLGEGVGGGEEVML